MRRLGLLAVGLWASLACGGVGKSVDVQAHLLPLCDASGSPIEGDLVEVEGPPKRPGDGPTVWVRADGGLRVDGLPTDDLAGSLAQAMRQARGLGRGDELVKLAVDREVPAGRVAEVLVAVGAAGVSRVELVAWSSTRRTPPVWADPALAEELKAWLASEPPEQWGMTLAGRFRDELQLCPGAAEAVAAVAGASPENRCRLMVAGFAESLPSCPLTDAARVVTLTQVMLVPADDRLPTARIKTVGRVAEVVAEDPRALWSEVWGRL